MKISPAIRRPWSALGRRKIATNPANMLSPSAMVDLDVTSRVALETM
jgi:hypothetical protein